jgi:hypothetical protein
MRKHRAKAIAALAMEMIGMTHVSQITVTQHHSVSNPDNAESEVSSEETKPITNGLYGRRLTKTQTATGKIVQAHPEKQ